MQTILLLVLTGKKCDVIENFAVVFVHKDGEAERKLPSFWYNAENDIKNQRPPSWSTKVGGQQNLAIFVTPCVYM